MSFMQLAKVSRSSTVAVAMAALGLGLGLQALTPRAADAAVFKVLNTNSFGSDSLDSAIDEANTTPGPDTIIFDIPATGVQTINLTSDLPTITDPVIINGYSQPGAKANTKANGTDAVLLIQINGAGAGSTAKGLQITAPNCVIRGLVINRFAVDGIRISGVGATGNKIQGCYIGTNVVGMGGLPNGDDGVQVENGASNNTIGGTTPATRNVISGNTGDGVQLGDPGTNGNLVAGNYIGVTAPGTGALGNEDGVVCKDGASLNRIGTGTASAANRIAFNREDGVLIKSSSAGNSARNQIRRNSIYSNRGLGINLQAASDADSTVTLNDAKDVDTGPNARQNYPVITAASSSSAGTTVNFTLNSIPSTSTVTRSFIVEFFSSPTEDPSHFGEGKTFLGTKTVTTNTTGNVTSSLAITRVVRVGHFVTATATYVATGDTSEFGRARAVVAATSTSGASVSTTSTDVPGDRVRLTVG